MHHSFERISATGRAALARLRRNETCGKGRIDRPLLATPDTASA